MITRIETIAFEGIEIKSVDVQVHISDGLPCFNIVGLPDKTVGESRERLRSAFSAIGLSLPLKRIIVNLSPADLIKEGSHFDLPIAIAILANMGAIDIESICDFVAVGEIALDGIIKETNGVFAASIFANSKTKGLIFPYHQINEVKWLNNKIELLPVKSLMNVINYFKGNYIVNKNELTLEKNEIVTTKKYCDLSEIKGQIIAKRALEVVASGGHNLLMIGSPGSGKSMLASALVGILPSLTIEEAIEVSLIYSIAGKMQNSSLIQERPFRSPHHSSSMAALIGGGKKAVPGEITLANCGVLFLDELAEFPKNVLDSLRQPIETGSVHIARVNAHVEYPAKFQLIAAMNPCRCGYFNEIDRQCSKAPFCAETYQSKISGPMFDRIDICLEVPTIKASDLYQPVLGEKSEIVKNRVEKVREIQYKRYLNYGIRLNSEASSQILEDTSNINKNAKNLLLKSMDKLSLSARAYYRILRVARTIADMDSSLEITEKHVAESVNYRKINYTDKLKKTISK